MSTVYDFTAKTLDGRDVSLGDYRGKTMLIVNTASQCGFTYQYEGLEKLYRDYKDRGFAVLPGETAIVPVVIREEIDLCRLCKALLEQGIYINPFLRPAAAQNLLRISCTAAHTERHVERLVETLVRVSHELGIER